MRTIEDRFWAKVEPTGFCWNWTGWTTPKGYGKFDLPGGAKATAHRMAYELLVAPIPNGLDIDHLCRNKRCVNPDHLEPVTPAENNRRKVGKVPLRSHCKHGHEFTPENTKMSARGARVCKRCKHTSEHVRRKRVRARARTQNTP